MKILHFIHGLHIGGAETFLCNYLLAIDSRIETYFVIQDPEITNPTLQNYIQLFPNRLFIIPDFIKFPRAHYKELTRLISIHDFEYIHVHMNALINPFPLIVSSKLKNKIIIHSHSISSQAGKLGILVHKINKSIFLTKKQIKLACSNKAGKWMFSNRDFEIIDNAIPFEKFIFNANGREKIRNLFNIPASAVVIGSVGRLVAAKNHKFIIEIFKNYHNFNTNSYLLIVGDGLLMNDLQEYVKSLELTNNVIFTGSQDHTQLFYSAMDCFLMPSHFEGLGFTAIEAQASGLPVIASKAVPPEVQLSDIVTYLPLNNISLWTNTILSSIEKVYNKNRIKLGYRLKNSRFDINSLSYKLKNLYNLNQ